jgi:hypothetical protein
MATENKGIALSAYCKKANLSESFVTPEQLIEEHGLEPIKVLKSYRFDEDSLSKIAFKIGIPEKKKVAPRAVDVYCVRVTNTDKMIGFVTLKESDLIHIASNMVTVHEVELVLRKDSSKFMKAMKEISAITVLNNKEKEVTIKELFPHAVAVCAMNQGTMNELIQRKQNVE